MIELADLGLKSAAPNADEAAALTVPSEPGDEYAPGPLVPGTTASRALYEVWRGTPFVLVSSPPGAGKTTLVVDIVHRLNHGTKMIVAIVAPTRRACIDMAKRLAEKTGPGVVLLHGSAFANMDLSKYDVMTKANDWQRRFDVPQVFISTVASANFTPLDCDVLVFDEAFQSTFGDALGAAARAKTVLMVGDPGQIGPVVTLDDSLFQGRKVSPVMRAPEAFCAHIPAKYTVNLSLPSTYRLGPETAAAIAPLYPFKFDSKRPKVQVRGVSEIQADVVDDPDSVSDPALIKAVTDRVQSLAWSKVDTADGEKTLYPDEIAVVASRNEQTAAIEARLAGMGLDGVQVGTADRLQGAQMLAVVALDPITGADVASAHALDTGRLCVMASRHIAHLTWITSESWREVLDNSISDKKDLNKHVAVREAFGCR